MTIGNKLKELRLSLGLSRKNFAHGIIDESYLAYIENGRSEIRVNDLIAILQANNLSILEFLTDFGDVNFNLTLYESKAGEAFIIHDTMRLKQLYEACPNILVKEVISLMSAKLKNKLDEFPKKTKTKIKKIFWQIKQWDSNSLWILSNVMEIYSFNDLKGLINPVFHNFSTPSEYEDETIKLLAVIVLNYLQICLTQSRVDKEEIKKVSTYLDKLPEIPLISFEKIKSAYLLALYHADYQTTEKISSILSNFN